MPYTYLPGNTYLQAVDGEVHLVHDGDVFMSMTPEEARSNAQDLLEAADKAESQTVEE